jgi:hypothetical protein
MELRFAESFDAEMNALFETHPAEVELIDALFDELAADQEQLDSLLDEVPKWHYFFEPSFEIKKFGECWDRKLRIYTLKLYDEDGHLIDYRVLVGHDRDEQVLFVLSVQPRASVYNANTAEFGALCATYEQLGIPKIR